MIKFVISVCVIGICLLPAACATKSSLHDPLVNGKSIDIEGKPTQSVGSLPINLAVSPDGRFAITTDAGFHEALWSIRTSDGKGVSHVDFLNEREKPSASPAATKAAGEGDFSETAPGSSQTNGLYYGLAISRDNIVYAAQGNHDAIAVLTLWQDGHLSWTNEIKTRPRDFPAGLALDARGFLYVTNNSAGGGNPFQRPGSVSIYDTRTKKEVGRYSFTASHGGTSNFPLGIAVLQDGSRAFIASERDDAVYVLDTHDPMHPKLFARIPTGAQPVAVLLSRDERQLFVANSLSDTISIVDVSSNQVTGTVLLRPRAARDLPGATPIALALSPDGKSLYAALGDMNAVAVVDLEHQTLLGYVPTGWYPTALAVTHDGRQLLVANGKGGAARNPNDGPDPYERSRQNAFVLNVLEGNVIAVDLPRGGSQLAKATHQVLKENRLDRLAAKPENPLPDLGLSSGKIKHVIYIVKENRTYDQILGDLPQGNGAPSLAQFGREVTPNQHALAERFVLLDNFYVCGDVSGDGWTWSTQGMANAYTARNVPYHYSKRGRKFDYEGQNNGLSAGGAPENGPDGRPLATAPELKNGTPPMPDVAGTGRYIWTDARKAGLSIRNYGFFCYIDNAEAGITGGPDNYPTERGLQPAGHDLDGITDFDYRRFDLDYPDSPLTAELAAQTGHREYRYPRTSFGKSQMPSRFSEWNREFQMMLKKSPDGSAVPALTLIRLPSDHTVGAKSGQHSPRAMLADNDYALGEIVQAVSSSPIWKNTAIFVLEDDAQSGVDHVDAHRSGAYVISPWIKRSSIDHRFANTDSMLKTMELLLGLEPLSQYDAVADPIMDWDHAPKNAEPFEAIVPPQKIVCELNPKASDLRAGDPRRKLAIESDRMDFTHADAAPAERLDEITWQTVHGPQSPMPQIRRGALTKLEHEDDDD